MSTPIKIIQYKDTDLHLAVFNASSLFKYIDDNDLSLTYTTSTINLINGNYIKKEGMEFMLKIKETEFPDIKRTKLT